MIRVACHKKCVPYDDVDSTDKGNAAAIGAARGAPPRLFEVTIDNVAGSVRNPG